MMRRLNSESGIAMAWAIVFVVVVSSVVGITFMAAAQTVAQTKSGNVVVRGSTVTQTAVATYLRGLRSGAVKETSYGGTSFQLPYTAVTQLDPSAQVIQNCPSILPAGLVDCTASRPLWFPTYTVKIPGPTSTSFGYWQIFHIFPPNYANADERAQQLIVYLRTWTATSDSAAPQGLQYYRAVFRAELLSDFQIVADGPIPLEPNAEINGRVHSNGYVDGRHYPPVGAPADMAIWKDGSSSAITCTGPYAAVTTAQGSIHDGIPSGCQQTPATGDYVSLGSVAESVSMMQSQCNLPTVRYVVCFASTNQSVRWKVTLNGDKMIVCHPDNIASCTTYSIATPAMMNTDPAFDNSSVRRVSVAMFDHSVDLYSKVATYTERLTLVSWGQGSDNSSIVVYNNLRRDNSIWRANLGLIARNNVTLKRPSATSCISRLDASIVAATGSLTLDPSLLTIAEQTGKLMQCSSSAGLTINGSIAGHYAPTLYWKWNATSWIGYTERTYKWNPALLRSAPPMMPASDNWSVIEGKAANEDCLGRPGAWIATVVC